MARLSISARLRSEWRRWQTKPSAPWRPRIANYAREELAGVDMISVGPLFAEPGPGGVQYRLLVIVPEGIGKHFAPNFVMLDIAQDPFMATVYRTAFIVALEDFLAAAGFRHGFGAPPNTARKSDRASARPSGGRDGAQSRAQLKAYYSTKVFP